MSSLFSPAPERRRWLALGVVCLAQLMIVLDTTIVNVALPSIQRELHIAQGQLTWVVNAFLITFGSLLLLAGRLGDLFGRKRVFTAGLILFTGASLLCGVSASQGMLVGARFLQGVGAALQGSVILAIIVTEFPQPVERARAMSAYVFVAVAGGSLGLLAGGALTQLLSWHWIFFVNLPIGAATLVLGRLFVPADELTAGSARHVDWAGSALITSALMVAIYAVVQATSSGWVSVPVLGGGGIALLLLGAFAAWERRAPAPILPGSVLRLRGLLTSSLVRGLLVTGMYSTFFLGTLYLEHVRHLGAVQTGLAFLPWTLTVSALSLGLTARLVARVGAMRALVGGMLAVIGGLVLLANAGAGTAYFPTFFCACLLIGLGIGCAFLPLLTIAMADVPAADAGLASGIVNVSQQLFGALGLAVLATVATNHTHALIAGHARTVPALLAGYHLAFTVGGACVATGIVLALVLLRSGRPTPAVAEPAPLPVRLEPILPDRQAA